jgi:hypothetical protein
MDDLYEITEFTCACSAPVDCMCRLADRRMAEDAVDMVVNKAEPSLQFNAGPCVSKEKPVG